MMALVAWPALRQGSLASNQWLNLQRRFMPWANVSLVILLVTGLVQMTNDTNYSGFLSINSVWAWAILIKHLAFVGMVLITIFVQVTLYPSMSRLSLLAEKRPKTAAVEREETATARNLVSAPKLVVCGCRAVVHSHCHGGLGLPLLNIAPI